MIKINPVKHCRKITALCRHHLGLRMRSEVKSVKHMAVFIRWQIEISRGLRPLDPPWGSALRASRAGV